jgi:hypothetical protein
VPRKGTMQRPGSEIRAQVAQALLLQLRAPRLGRACRSTSKFTGWTVGLQLAQQRPGSTLWRGLGPSELLPSFGDASTAGRLHTGSAGLEAMKQTVVLLALPRMALEWP